MNSSTPIAPPAKGYTGRARRRSTSRRVALIDVFTRVLVTAGGIGTIVAVFTVCAFLVLVALPLFGPATTSQRGTLDPAPGGETPDAAGTGPRLTLGFDEYRTQGFILDGQGVVSVFRADTGAPVARLRPLGERVPTCYSYDAHSGTLTFGFGDGSIQFGRLRWNRSYFAPETLPTHVAAISDDELAVHTWQAPPASDASPGEGSVVGVVQRTTAGQLRGLALTVELEPVKQLGPGSIARIDHALAANDDPTVAYWMQESPIGPGLRLVVGKFKESRRTGARVLSFGKVIVPEAPALDPAPPELLALSNLGAHLLVAWRDGRAIRLRCDAAAGEARVAETLDLIPSGTATIGASALVIGRETLIVGDSSGAVSVHFAVPDEVSGYETLRVRDVLWVFNEGSPEVKRFKIDGALPASVALDVPARELKIRAPSAEIANAYVESLNFDGMRLARTRVVAPARGKAVTALAASQRSRTISVGYADGSVDLYQVTSGKRLAGVDGLGGPVAALTITPKENGFAALSAQRLMQWDLAAGHPQATPSALFAPVWYEGYALPEHMWQATSGGDESEPKLGLVPLVFGTIKATAYSMLFGAPLALLAALYTSQFLNPKHRAVIKPMIEMMASLPSVVLGFLSALVFAPLAERHLAGLVGVGLTLPVCLLGGACLWQLLPFDRAQAWSPFRLVFIALALAGGIAAGLVGTGPWLEAQLFEGDMVAYLDGAHALPRRGDPASGWFLLLLPLCAIAAALVSAAVSHSWLGGRARNWTRKQAAIRDLAKLSVAILAAISTAYALAAVLGLTADPRGPFSPIDTYVQRNAMIVGFVMGFAVIPIIFTIADDALASVPAHLIFASLGAGATPWQTAMRVVVPTAMSGLFSAVMVGLGRAVGETMIVLMAAGNTPIMQANLFNGFRTLSANIATEMPEAVQGSTHYRILFLTALLLFAVTFVLNSMAEIVRLRFRTRAGEL